MAAAIPASLDKWNATDEFVSIYDVLHACATAETGGPGQHSGQLKKRRFAHSPSADDDYARRFFSLRSERVTVSGRLCFGRRHGAGDRPSLSSDSASWEMGKRCSRGFT